MTKIDFSKDILICVKRLEIAEDTLRLWLKTAGKIPFKNVQRCLDEKGCKDIELLPHPFTNYTDEEKDIFIQCFGKPLVFPKKFMINTPFNDVITEIVKRRELLAETIAMTKDSRFRNYQTKKKKNGSNARTSGNRNNRDSNLGRTRDNSKRPNRKTQSKTRHGKYNGRRKETRTGRHPPRRR